MCGLSFISDKVADVKETTKCMWTSLWHGSGGGKRGVSHSQATARPLQVAEGLVQEQVEQINQETQDK